MKLPKVIGCLFLIIGGNLQEQTTLVEGQGIGLWTRVRLPSSPFLVLRRDPACREDSLVPTQMPIRTCSDLDAFALLFVMPPKEGLPTQSPSGRSSDFDGSAPFQNQ